MFALIRNLLPSSIMSHEIMDVDGIPIDGNIARERSKSLLKLSKILSISSQPVFKYGEIPLDVSDFFCDLSMICVTLSLFEHTSSFSTVIIISENWTSPLILPCDKGIIEIKKLCDKPDNKEGNNCLHKNHSS